MRIGDVVACRDFPCQDANPAGYNIPACDLQPEKFSVLLISEAAPPNPGDGYYAAGSPLFARTTLQAFQDAGAKVAFVADLLALGVYLTTAVRCAKAGYAIASDTILACSRLLEKEMAVFSRIKSILLMGDVSIKAMNAIARRKSEPRVIPAGSTYKIRAAEYYYHGARVLPSYLQAGPSFYIEKSNRRMIAEDIAAALSLLA